MSKQLVLTTFKKCFEETISDAFLCGTALNVNSLLQDKNVNYFRGITPSHDGWGLIDDANSFFAIVAPRGDVKFHEQPTLFCSFQDCDVVAFGDDIEAHYSSLFTDISPKWAYYWALRIGNQEAMRKVIINSRNKFYSKCWVNNINQTDKELIAISLEVNN